MPSPIAANKVIHHKPIEYRFRSRNGSPDISEHQLAARFRQRNDERRGRLRHWWIGVEGIERNGERGDFLQPISARCSDTRSEVLTTADDGFRERAPTRVSFLPSAVRIVGGNQSRNGVPCEHHSLPNSSSTSAASSVSESGRSSASASGREA